MLAELNHLIEKALTGEPERIVELTAALQAAGGVEPALLIDLLHSPHEAIRRAAALAVRGRSEPEVIAALLELTVDGSAEVRQALAETIRETPGWPFEAVVECLLQDPHSGVRWVAAQAAQTRPTLHPLLVARLATDDYWGVRQCLAQVLAHVSPELALPALLTRLAEDGDSDVQRACADSAEKHLAGVGASAETWPRPRVALLREARSRVAAANTGTHSRLLAWLQERLRMDVDLDELRNFGTVLTEEAEASKLPRAHGVANSLKAVRAALFGPAPRAVVLLGEPGCGKTAIVHELVHQLRAEDWHLVRVSPTEFMAGTRYTGEWETRVTNLISAVKAPKRIIVYVPNLQDLSAMGTWSKSDASVATALAPHIERGEVVMIGESSTEAFRSGLGAITSLRRLFHPVEVPAADLTQTKHILQAVRDETTANVADAVLERLIELTDFYLAGTSQPGRSVGLLRRVLGNLKDPQRPVAERDILKTLSGSTGIPVDFLDDARPLDRAVTRAFFEARVMGQTDAVDAVVDLVTLIKAGLTDPGKPFGIHLFVGPTGVGKTELARALAEYLFGDVGRLVRFDMSEFATFEAHERLIGWGTRPGLLTGAIRERPFAVLLLDEIEKAHPNVFDLCLQVFDAGRLTDTQGRTVDFRRTIVILTSNIGAVNPTESPYGFGRPSTGLPAVPDRETMLRELGRCFRPEFLNRLDRIVSFRPLALETAEKIARREVARVLERSGLARRRLAIDVDPAVFNLLLREGYSPAFGARPLKRTVERLLLLPLAEAITGASVPSGAVVRLVARQSRVEVQIEAPEAADSGEPRLPRAQALPVAERVMTLKHRLLQVKQGCTPLNLRKSALLERSTQPGFWDQRWQARTIMDEIYRLDSILGMVDAFDQHVHDEQERFKAQHGSETELSRIDERVQVLEGELVHLGFLVQCRNAQQLGNALVTLTRVASHGGQLDGVERLAQMYGHLARRRGFQLEVLDDRQGGDPPEDTITLLLSGAGAYALLGGETGLHQVAGGKKEVRGAKKRYTDREVVRVEVLPVPVEEAEFQRDDLRLESKTLEGVKGRLMARPRHALQLFHVPSMTAARAWMDGSRSEAIAKLKRVLQARLQNGTQEQAASIHPHAPLVRRYTLGPSPLVRDLRSGKSTGRLDLVFEGRLEAFLAPPQ